MSTTPAPSSSPDLSPVAGRPVTSGGSTWPSLPSAPPTAALQRLGWDDAWSAALRQHHKDDARQAARRDDLCPARVVRGDRGACDLLLADGPDGALTPVTAVLSPALERRAAADPTVTPATGDWVLADPPSDRVDGRVRWTVSDVLPRRTAVHRAQVTPGSSRDQVLAANADAAVVVEGLAPDPDPGRIERLLALAWASGARPVVVLTKADLVTDPESMRQDVVRLAPGVDVLATSCTLDVGLEPLRAWLAEGATLALLGASGVGKSTLLNALVAGRGEVMRTQSLRGDGKGRHTTVTRELHLAPDGGSVLDTPGLRTVGLTEASALADVFPDVDELSASCRFSDCDHRTEPGCAVLAAVEAGDLPQRRLDSYRKLLREAAHREARVDARLRAAQAGKLRAQQRQRRRSATRP